MRTPFIIPMEIDLVSRNCAASIQAAGYISEDGLNILASSAASSVEFKFRANIAEPKFPRQHIALVTIESNKTITISEWKNNRCVGSSTHTVSHFRKIVKGCKPRAKQFINLFLEKLIPDEIDRFRKPKNRFIANDTREDIYRHGRILHSSN